MLVIILKCSKTQSSNLNETKRFQWSWCTIRKQDFCFDHPWLVRFFTKFHFFIDENLKTLEKIIGNNVYIWQSLWMLQTGFGISCNYFSNYSNYLFIIIYCDGRRIKLELIQAKMRIFLERQLIISRALLPKIFFRKLIFKNNNLPSLTAFVTTFVVIITVKKF